MGTVLVLLAGGLAPAAYVGTWPTFTSLAGYQGTNYQVHAVGTAAVDRADNVTYSLV